MAYLVRFLGRKMTFNLRSKKEILLKRKLPGQGFVCIIILTL
jgi:hypothetical protein